MKGYLAGPMKGYPDGNKPLFHEYARILRAQGHEVLSPAEVEWPEGVDDATALYRLIAIDIEYVLDSECVWLIPGWLYSKGAKIELTVALATGKKIFDAASGRELTLGVDLAINCEHAHTAPKTVNPPSVGPHEKPIDSVLVTTCLDCGRYPVMKNVEFDAHFKGIR